MIYTECAIEFINMHFIEGFDVSCLSIESWLTVKLSHGIVNTLLVKRFETLLNLWLDCPLSQPAFISLTGLWTYFKNWQYLLVMPGITIEVMSVWMSLSFEKSGSPPILSFNCIK